MFYIKHVIIFDLYLMLTLNLKLHYINSNTKQLIAILEI